MGQLDDVLLANIEREYPDGISSQEILDIFKAADSKLSEATLRKYVQLGLLPRSVRVGKKGKHQGSQGLYPASVVRQIVRIREMMAQDFTIEQIQRDFLFVRGDIEELERVLEKVFDAFEAAARGRSSETMSRAVTNDLMGARRQASELVEKFAAIEQRFIAKARLTRAAG